MIYIYIYMFMYIYILVHTASTCIWYCKLCWILVYLGFFIYMYIYIFIYLNNVVQPPYFGDTLRWHRHLKLWESPTDPLRWHISISSKFWPPQDTIFVDRVLYAIYSRPPIHGSYGLGKITNRPFPFRQTTRMMASIWSKDILRQLHGFLLPKLPHKAGAFLGKGRLVIVKISWWGETRWICWQQTSHL